MSEEFIISKLSKKRWTVTGIIATLFIVLSVPFYLLKTEILTPLSAPSVSSMSPSFVGREKCIDCHRTEYEQWLTSDHDKAMDVATDDTVQGDFSNVLFEEDEFTARFYRDQEKFFVQTRGPDGKMGDFEITHTFGTYPLQQYLVPFPGGRLQCLAVAWDAVKKSWYLLPDSTNDSKDWLHWTQGGQNWNGMCAECHSTHLQKNYDHKKDTFSTTWSEIDVSCEACHGPSSQHVKWAEQPEMAREEAENYKLVVKTRDIDPADQLRICARCHSRRSLLGDFKHSHGDLMDAMIPQLLNEGLYYADGQIQHEVFVYGSFNQSKMFARDVKCSDCHDVHSLKLKKDGNDLCLQCHRSDIYDSESHHFHKATYNGTPSDGNDCVKCHMPGTDYMGIDNRADHSIRIPRPDLSITLGSPNACNSSGCHDDQTNEWSAKAISEWYGLRKRPHYGTTLAAGRAGDPEAQGALIKLARDQLYPPIVRATAISLLRLFPDSTTIGVLEQALSDREALIRYTVVVTVDRLRYQQKESLLVPMLYDPVKAVRTQAALALAVVKPKQLDPKQKKVFDRVLREYEKTTEYTADFPSGRYNRGILFTALDKPNLAIESYKEAIRIDDRFFVAKNNLAMLYSQLGKRKNAEKLFLEILETQPDLLEVSYSLGLLLAEQNRYQEAVVYLKKAADGLPHRPRIYYNLGLLLQHLKQDIDAGKAFTQALRVEPDNYDFLYAMAGFLIKRGRINEAMRVAQRMIIIRPNDKTGADLLKYINRQSR